MEEAVIALARLGAGVFAGTCLYVTAVGHPVRMASAVATALPHFNASLGRSERMQPALHVFFCCSSSAPACWPRRRPESPPWW